MKKFMLGLLIGLMISTSFLVFAETEQFTALKASFNILVNGIAFSSEKPAVVIDGSTYLPLKAIGEALGTKVIWNNDEFRVEIGETPVDVSQADVIEEGMYKVGIDIPAGEYLVTGSDNAYLAVSKDSSGTLGSIINNEIFTGTLYITVASGQYLDLSNCTMIPISKAPIQQPVNGKYIEGMYKVGRDIPAGEYKAIPATVGASAYIEVSKDSLGILDSIVANDLFTSTKYITIGAGQYIKLSNCYLIK